jgi:purine-nucleoside phosphorylase
MMHPPTPDAPASARALRRATGVDRHNVAVVLGSGWLPAAEILTEAASRRADISLDDLGGFPPATVPGHTRRARSLTVGSLELLLYLGRVHGYEGYEPAQVVHGVRTACAAGVETVVLTNAAGGLRADFSVGQPVLIGDHLNLTGRTPLVGPRFVDLTDAYDPKLRSLARSVDPGLVEGVYAGVPGPQYETPAEIRVLRGLGADLVGMSTVHETIAARAEGARVLALSLVTNLAAGMTGAALDHAEVLAAGAAAARRMGTLLAELVTRLPTRPRPDPAS